MSVIAAALEILIPDDAGVVVLIDDAGVTHRGLPDAPGAVLIEGYVPHWSSCPDQARFRRRSQA